MNFTDEVFFSKQRILSPFCHFIALLKERKNLGMLQIWGAPDAEEVPEGREYSMTY